MLNNLPLEKIFKTALKNGGDFSDIFYESTFQSTVVADNNRIEKIVAGTDIGIGLRVIYDGHTAYGYSNELSEKSLLELADGVAEAVNGSHWDKNINFSKIGPAFAQKVEIKPDSISLSQKAEVVKKANTIARGFDKKIQQASIAYKDSVRNISIANSFGELVEDEKIDTIFIVTVVASDGKKIQTGYEIVGGFVGFEFFNGNYVEKTVKPACRRALMMLTAKPAPAGTMPVILSSEAGGTMVHEAVGHGLEADLAINGFSVYKDCVGQQVASKLITVVDDSTIPGKRGSFSFDDEGIPSQKTILIENGILKNYMHNRITAKKAGTKSTGNGRRETYKFRPVVRMTNTIIQPGSDDPQSIIKRTDRGLLVKKIGGGQVNTISGDFVFEVQEGYLIKHGQISDPVRGATLTGNGPEVLRKIDMVGSDLGFAIGTCGKDAQGVPVGDAQPTLRIPELVVGGTSA